MRGNLALLVLGDAVLGSIPACAGEPPGNGEAGNGLKVYPRVCGGTSFARHNMLVPSGLSPRVRGNPSHGSSSKQPAGSIPACAGEPALDSNGTPAPGVYPRVCGGTSILSSAIPSSGGLSPRVRGNPGGLPTGIAAAWSIPACAGEPLTKMNAAVVPGVYPRVCGGTTTTGRWTLKYRGLSPRVRGNHGGHYIGALATRSIPACAGEPPEQVARPGATRVYPRVCGGTFRSLY